MGQVRVVGFKFYDIEKDEQLPRPVKATRERLASMAGAVEIEGTEETVDESTLDGHGFYRPKP